MPTTTRRGILNSMSEPILCGTCNGSGKVCIKCQEPLSRCRCVSWWPGIEGLEEAVSGYEPVLCDRCEGEGTV
jgi:hypothetical protein